MATRHDPWNMRLGGFVTSQSFREAAANYEKEQEKNKEKPAARRQAGRVRPRASPQHQQPRAKRARRQDPPPQTTVQWRTQTHNPQPPPLPRRGTQFRLRWRLCLHSLCVILLKLLRTSVREVCSSTPQYHGNKKTATQFCSLAACVSAWVLEGKVRMQRRHYAGPRNIFQKKKKQDFCVKMERKHFAGPRNILQTKRQSFCFVFLSILKIGPTGPTTGHWTENWSFYLIPDLTL